MIQKKWAFGLLLGVMLAFTSINLMSSQEDKNAFRSLLVQANSIDKYNMGEQELSGLKEKLESAAKKIGPTNVSSLSRNAGLRYSDVLSKISNKIADLQVLEMRNQISQLEGDLTAARSAGDPAGLAAVQAELASTKAKLAALSGAAPGTAVAQELAQLRQQVVTLAAELAAAQSATTKKSGPAPAPVVNGISKKLLNRLLNDFNTDFIMNLAGEMSDPGSTIDAADINTALGAYKIATPVDAKIIYDFVRRMAALYDAMKALASGEGDTVCTSIIACMNTQLNPILATFKFPVANGNERTTVNDMLANRFDKALLGREFGIEDAAKVAVTAENYLDLLTKVYVTDAAFTLAGYSSTEFAGVIAKLPNPTITSDSLKLEVQRMWDIYSKHGDPILQGAVKAYLGRVMEMPAVKDLTYKEAAIETTSDQIKEMGVAPTYKIEPVAAPEPSAWDLDSASAKIAEIKAAGKDVSADNIAILIQIRAYLEPLDHDDKAVRPVVSAFNSLIVLKKIASKVSKI